MLPIQKGPTQLRTVFGERKGVAKATYSCTDRLHVCVPASDQESQLAFSRVSIHELRNHEAFQCMSVMSPLICIIKRDMNVHTDFQLRLR